jgi:hypothetical protein
MRKQLWFWFLLFLIPGVSSGQEISIQLSSTHVEKLNAIQEGGKRLKKYHQFYERDSIRCQKLLRKKYRHAIDSAVRTVTAKERLIRRLARRGISTDRLSTGLDSLNSELVRWFSVLKDSSAVDSLKAIARETVRLLSLLKMNLDPRFLKLQQDFAAEPHSDWKKIAKDIPGLDTLKEVFDSNTETLFGLAEGQLSQRIAPKFPGMESRETVPSMEEIEGYKNELDIPGDDYRDKDQLRNKAKHKVMEKAINYLGEHGNELVTVQNKLNRLLRKYQQFSNSEDLSTAVKHTSLKGRTFFEHLLVGGNFNVISIRPVAIDLSPMIGYKFNRRVSTGIGANYRCTFADSIRNQRYISPGNRGLKVFLNYDLYRGLFAYAELERSGLSIKKIENAGKRCSNNYFIGVGKKILIHPKIYFTTVFTYNLNNSENNPFYPRRFQVKLGFQLS